MAILDKVKTSLRVVTDDFDDEISDLITSAQYDLGCAGIAYEQMDELILRAIITYCRMNFGNPENYDRLKRSYDEQKAQMSMRTGYTQWIEA